MASVRRDGNGGGGLVGGWSKGHGVVALAAALTAVSLVESAYAGKNVQVDHIARGTAKFDRNGSVLTIRAADRTIINYRRFDVGSAETVRFIQPSATSRVLNRITSSTPSKIDGTVTANGVVYFVNPSGIMFGHNAVINVGHFYAAAGTITDANFLANINQFKTTGAVVNQGVINGDAVALIGRTVANAGTIAAEGGLVTMVAGDDVLLGTRDGHIMVKVGSTDDSAASAGSAPKGSVTNTGTVRAGTMALAGGDMYAMAIGGAVKAKNVSAQTGGDVVVTGTIDASDAAAGAKGGNVVVTGKNVALQGATIDASGDAGGGNVLVGGDFQGKGETPRATNTAVDNGTTITASATGSGDGGNVVVWSDNKTTYNGSIYAKGGAAGGNGGRVEVSGKGHLDFNGAVDTTAPQGNVGSLLLDPHDLTIQLGSPDVHGDGSNLDVSGDIAAGDDGANDSIITAGQLATLLDTTDVSLAATNDINVDAMVDASSNVGSHGLTLDAGHDINVNQPILLNNANLTLNAGNSVFLPTTGGINTNGGDVSITAGADVAVEAGIAPFLIQANHLTVEAGTGIGAVTPMEIFLTGGLEAHSTTGDVQFHSTGILPLDVGFAGGTKGGVIADGGNVSIDYDGGIRVATAGHVVSASGDVTLEATGDIVTDNFDSVGAGQVQAGGQVTISAGGNVTLGQTGLGDVHAGNGLSITATGGTVTIDNGTFVEADAGNVGVTAGTAVTLGQTATDQAHLWNNGAGTLTVTAPSFSADSGGTPASVQSGGSIAIVADDVSFSDGIASTSGSVTFSPLTAGRGISLADAAVAGQLTLTGTELSLVSGSKVVIGDATSGDISVAGTINQPGSGWDTLHLITAGAVSDAAGGTLQVDNLAVEAHNGITLHNQAQFIGTFAAANTSSGGIAIQNGTTLTVGVVDGVNGVSSTAGDVTFIADKFDVGAAVTATGQAVKFRNRSASIGADLGSATDASATAFELSQAELSNVSAARVEVQGDGAVAISSDIDGTGHWTELSLWSNTSSVGGSGAITVSSLAAGGFGAVTLDGANAISTVAGSTSSSFSVTSTLPLTVGTVAGFSGVTTLNNDTITLTADSLTLSQPVSAGTGIVTIQNRTAGLGIDLGSKPGGKLGLDQADLDQITAGVVRVGRNDASASGDVDLSAAVTAGTGWDTLHVLTGGNVAGAGTLGSMKLAVSAVGSVTLTGNNGFFQFAGTGSSFDVRSGNAVDVTTVDGVAGVATTGDGPVTVTSDGINVSSAINAGTGTVTLRNYTAGQAVSLGGADGVGVLGLSASDVANVSAGTLVVGRNDGSASGDVTVADNIATGANLVILTGGAVAQDAAVTGTGLTAGTLAIEAVTGIGASGQPVTTAVAGLEAGTDTGGIFISNTGDLTIGGVSASLNGVRVATSGAIEIASAGSVTIASTGETVVAPGNITITATGASADVVTGGQNAISGGAAVDSTGGSVTLSADRDVAIGQSDYGDVHAAGGLTITAGRDATFDHGSFVETDGGNAVVTGDNSIQFLQTAATTGAHLWNNGTGTLTLNTPSLVSNSGGTPATIQTGGGAGANVVLNVDTLSLSDAIDAGTATITIRPLTAGRGVSLADSAVAGQLTLTGTDLGLMTGSAIVVGGASAGDISVAGTINQAAGWDTLHLVTGGSVSDLAGGTLQVDNLAAEAVTGIDLSNQSHLVGTFAAANSTSGGVSLTNAAPLAVGTADGVAGITSGGNVTLTTDALDITQDINAGAGVVTLKPLTAGTAIDLGTEVGGKLSLTVAELNHVTASVLRVGDAAAGDINVSNADDTAAGWNTLHLISGGNVGETGTVTADALAVEATGAIDLSFNNTVGTFAASAGTTFALRSTTDLLVDTVDGVSGITADGLTQVSSDLSLTLNQNVTVGAGPGHILVLSTANGITQTGGTVTTDALAVYATTTGDITLDQAGNNVGKFAADSAGDVTFRNDGAFAVDVVNGVTGIAAHGDVTLTIDNAGDLTVAQPVTTDGGDFLATVSAGAFSATAPDGTIDTRGLNAGDSAGDITITASGAVSVATDLVATGTDNAAGDGGDGGDVTISGSSVSLAGVNTSGGNSTSVGGTGGNAGNIDVTGAAILGGDVTAAAGTGDTPGSANNVAFHGSVVLANDLTITAHDVTFSSTVDGTTDGGEGLIVQSDAAGTLTLGGAVGGGTRLEYLAVNGGATTLINGGSVATASHQSYSGPVTLGADTTLDAGGQVGFDSTVRGATDGGESLDITAAGTTFAGAVGDGGKSLESLSVTGTVDLNGGSVTTAGGQTYDGAATLSAHTALTGTTITLTGTVDGDAGGPWDLTLHNSGLATFGGTVGAGDKIGVLLVDGPVAINGGSVKTTANQTYNGAVTLGADATLTGNDITFGSTVDGATDGGESLTLANAGTATFGGAVGATHALEFLHVGGAAVINGGSVTTAAGQDYDDTVVIGANTTLTGSTITFASTVDGDAGGPWDLTLHNSGLATFGGAVGAGDKIGVLVVDGPAAINGGSVKTTANQTYTGAVTLGADTTLTGAAISFGSTIDGAHSLHLVNSATATLGGAVGGTTALTTLTIDGASTLSGGSIKTTGGQTYTGPVTLGSTLAIDTTTVGFGSTVQAAADGVQGLSITNSGLATFGGAVGGSGKALASLSVSGDSAINGGSVTTTGGQTYSGAATIGTHTVLSGSTITFGDTLAGGVGGPWDLTLHNSGLATFGGTVGAGNTIHDLVVDGDSAIDGGSVLTTGLQTYTGAVTLGADTTLTGIAISFGSTVDGAHSLHLVNSATATLGGAVGGTTKLTTLTIDGESALNGGSVKTTGLQTYTQAVTLGADTALTGTDVTFGSTVGGSTNGGESLAILNTGTVTFKGNVGTSVLRLESLTIDGATTIDAAGATSVFTAGAQHYKGAFTTKVNLTLTGSSATFDSTVRGGTSGGQSLTVAGAATFNNAVGDAGKAFSTLSVSGATAINGGSVTTTGAQSYGAAVTVGANATLTGTAITFASTVNGATDGGQSLTLANPGSLATFGGAVGNDVRLSSLTVSGNSAINGGSVRTTGAQTYTGAATLGADTTLTATAVTFGSTLNAASAGGQGLTLHNSAVATFNDTVGGTAALKFLTIDGPTSMNAGAVTTTGDQSYGGELTLVRNATLHAAHVTLVKVSGGSRDLTVDAAATLNGAVAAGNLAVSGTAAINGGSVTTTGTQTYTGAATLGTDTTLTGTTVTFGSTLDASAAGGQALTVGGHARFQGDVGTTASLKSLTVNGAADVGDGNHVVTKGNQLYNGVVTVSGSGATFHAGSYSGNELAAPGTITFKKDLNTSGAVVINGATGITFNGDVVGSDPAADTLTLQVPWVDAEAPAVVHFAAANGPTRVRNLSKFKIENPLGDTVTPQVATVAVTSAGGITIEVTDAFTMARNQKMTAAADGASITINVANGTASLGDLNAPHAITVHAKTIELMARAPGKVIRNDHGKPAISDDKGLDFVSNNLTFDDDAAVTVNADGQPGKIIFSFYDNTPATGFLNKVNGAVLLHLPKPVDPALMTLDDVVLDLPPTGTTPINPSVLRAGLAQVHVVQPSQEAGISEAAQALLSDIGVRTRAVTNAELIEGLEGRGMYVQADEQNVRVAVPRLNGRVLERAIDIYYKSLFVTEGPSAPANLAEAKASVKETLTRALDAYKVANPGSDVVDPVAFAHFVETTPEQAAAYGQMLKIQSFLFQLDLLSLTPKELADARDTLCAEVAPSAMPVEAFIKAVTSLNGGGSAAR